jgi:hypothetical protein
VPEVVSFTAPHQVALVACDEQPLTPGSVRVRTWFSGISAGTELTAYRGSNPYLTGTWDPDRRLFIEGEPTFGYPVDGWGYSEVGQILEVADDVVSPAVGDVVHGIWGHRSEAVLPAANVAHRVWTADDAISGLDRLGRQEPRADSFSRGDRVPHKLHRARKLEGHLGAQRDVGGGHGVSSGRG